MKIGNVNAFVKSTGWIGKKLFEFDGTTKGLVKSAIANGAIEGTKVFANFAGKLRSEAKEYRIVLALHDDRANGFWIERK